MILVRCYIGLRNISSSGVYIISKTFHRYKFIEFTSVLLLNGNRTSSSSSSIPRERLERTTVRNIFKPLPSRPPPSFSLPRVKRKYVTGSRFVSVGVRARVCRFSSTCENFVICLNTLNYACAICRLSEWECAIIVCDCWRWCGYGRG